jgi:hypothetical protein
MRALIFVFALTSAGLSKAVSKAPPSRLNIEQDRVYAYDLPRMAAAVTELEQRIGRLPTDNEGIRALVGINGITEVPVDPWGHWYHYAVADGGARIWSLGDDGLAGGVEQAADLEVWVLNHATGAGLRASKGLSIPRWSR